MAPLCCFLPKEIHSPTVSPNYLKFQFQVVRLLNWTFLMLIGRPILQTEILLPIPLFMNLLTNGNITGEVPLPGSGSTTKKIIQSLKYLNLKEEVTIPALNGWGIKYISRVTGMGSSIYSAMTLIAGKYNN